MEQIENSAPLEGAVDTPNQRQKVFTSYTVMLDFMAYAKPKHCNINASDEASIVMNYVQSKGEE